MLLAALLLQAAPLLIPSPPGDEAGCDRQATRYTPERQWSGVWVNHFEGSQFFEGATSAAKLPWRQNPVWFDDRGYIAQAAVDPADRGYAKAYRIRFIGRRTIDAPVGQKCGFSHFGMFEADIYPTRILLIERIGDLP